MEKEKQESSNADINEKNKKVKKKRKNFILVFFSKIGYGIKIFFTAILFGIVYICVKPFMRCKIKGRENIKQDDEARVFIANHYQMYGPLVMFLRFPYKNRIWIIDKMMDEKSVEHQMGLMVYNEFKKVPKFLIWIVLKVVKNLMVFSMKVAGGIPVSRENPRANVKAMQISTETMKKGKAILIFPEKDYVPEGVGIFMQGFEHIGKYYYGKTGKRISFYPMFISQKNKTIYISKPIVFNPENDQNDEKNLIVNYLRDEMVKQYTENEVNNPKTKKKGKNKENS